MAVSKIYLLDVNEIVPKVEQAIVEHQFYNKDNVSILFDKKRRLLIANPKIKGSVISKSEKDLEKALSDRNISWTKTLVLKDSYND